jgi:uroporphyrinogen decarboxylase
MATIQAGSMTGAERMLATARRQPADRTPVWFMRQAGRCLAGYRALRETYDILTITRTPELCARVTLMPVEEFGVDALRIVDPREATPELFEAIKLVRRELDGTTAVVGFAGGPFTVASYMIEGRPTKEFSRTKAMLHGEPGLWRQLMETLTEVTISYLQAQVEAGAQMIQLFDSWAGALSIAAYEAMVMPYSRRILEAVSETGVPTIHFGTTTSHLLESMARCGSDVISVDWRLPLDDAWRRIGDRGIQGNLDPGVMLAPFDVVAREARQVLAQAGGRPGHIFNLGHGVLPETSSDHLRRLAELVHAETARA